MNRSAPGRAAGPKMRVLIIDDEDDFRGMLRMMLAGEGYEVLDAPNGAEGLRLFSRARVDLVISDIFMPEKEGLETIMEIRNEDPDVKIIAISGGGRQWNLDFLPAAVKFGADAALQKPFMRSQLLETIRDVMGSKA